jgi:hypothetical protein
VANSKPIRYPDPQDVVFPDADLASPDQEFYTTILVAHNRLWLAAALSMALNALLVIGLVTLTARFKPVLQFVEFESGHVVTWNESGTTLVDGVEYYPARLRSVVSSFVRNRYEWDFQNTDKVRLALRLMSAEAQQAELRKIADFNPSVNVIGTSLKTELVVDWALLDVRSAGGGKFEVTVNGEARILDAVRYRDPSNPLVRPVSFTLVVQSITPTDLNPIGYEIVSTGNREIL